ncbi:hypothetical protein CQ046_16010 [Chryseobacterium sp. MYb7]|nr:hypothetical protein CQ046_16010 [Chryseobacterium sp. MYb7]
MMVKGYNGFSFSKLVKIPEIQWIRLLNYHFYKRLFFRNFVKLFLLKNKSYFNGRRKKITQFY